MGTTYPVRSNTYDIGDNSGAYYWQKQIEVDNDGKIFALVIDMPTTYWYMYLYYYTDTAGVYALDSNFTTRISDVAGKLASASMIFDSNRRYLHLAYTKVITDTYYLYHGIYDPVNGSWIENNLIHSSVNELYQHPDICLDNNGNPHIVYNTGTGSYQHFRIAVKSGNQWLVATLPDVLPDQYVACIACSPNNEIYLYVSLVTAGLGSLYIFPAGAPNFNDPINITLQDAVMVIDEMSDAHFIGRDALVAGNLDYWKYDYDTGTAAEVTAVIAEAGYDGTCKWGLEVRWDYANNRPDVYLFYVDMTSPNGVVSYKKYTTSLGTETDIDATVTDACIQAHLNKLPSNAAAGLLLVKWCDDDGTTPFPVEMYHGSTIQETPPSTGGYYGRGRIRNSTIYALNIDTGGFEKITQYPPQIIAVTNGAMSEDVPAQIFAGDSNNVPTFCTGYDIKEYSISKFNDDGRPISCILESGWIDFGDPDRYKKIDMLSCYYEATGDIYVYIMNEKGACRKLTLASADINRKMRVGFSGKRFKITISENSERDFKLYRIILYASTTETIL